MDLYNIPVGFGLALASNTAAMNRYAHLSEEKRQEIRSKAHQATSQEDMYALVANLAIGTME